MSELIRIKYQIDTQDVKEAENDLNKLYASQDKLAKQAKETNTQINAQGVAMAKADIATKNLANDLNKIGNPQKFGELNKSVEKLGANLKALPKPNIEQNANAAQKSIGGLSSSLKMLGGIAAGAFAFSEVIAFGKAVIDTTAEFQKFEAVLTNTLGSQKAAAEAMALIQNFAASTPFSVAELTDSFVKLSNSGLVPTENQLRQLGDVASSSGKSFDQLTEALLDASSGEFERLKEFGIKSSKAGEVITFTFKGVKTQVANTSEAITKYITGLGDLKGVSGGMAAISKTLGGQISNLGDSFDQLKLAIGSITGGFASGFISFLGSALTGITNLINGTNTAIAAFEAQKKSSENLALSITPLLIEYDNLAAKQNKSAAENERLAFLTAEIAKTLPNSATKWDEYGNALSVSTAKALELVQAESLLATKEKETAIATEERLIKEAERVKAYQASLVKAGKETVGFGLLSFDVDIDKAEIAAKVKTLDDEIAKRKATIDQLNGAVKPKSELQKATEASKVKPVDTASAEAAKKQAELEKDAAKQLRKLRQENAIDAAQTELDKARLKIRFEKENSELELKQTSQTAAIKKELSIKAAFDLAEAERKARQEANEKNVESALENQDLLFIAEKQNLEKLHAEKLITDEQLANSVYALELDNLAKRETAYNLYLTTLTGNDEVSKEKFADTQQKITEINQQENDLRTKNTLENNKKQEEATKQLLELRAKYGTGEVKVGAIRQLANNEAAKEADPQKAADIKIEAEKNASEVLLQEQQRAFDSQNELQKASLAQLRAFYAERDAIITKSFDTQIAEQIAAGGETTALEQQKADALKRSADDLKKAETQAIQDKLQATQQYVQQAGQLATQITDIYFAEKNKELDKEKEANSIKLADADKAINTTKSRLEKATGKQKKELQIQLANEEAQKKAIIESNKKVEDEKTKLQKEAAIVRKAIAISEAIISTAVAVVNTIRDVPKVDFGVAAAAEAALVAALGAAQVATIIAQPYAKGTLSVQGGIEGKDSVLANLMPGEAVIPTKIAREYAPVLEAIYKRQLPASVLNGLVLDSEMSRNTIQVKTAQGNTARLESQIRELNASLAPLRELQTTAVSVNMDTQGFSTYLQSGNQRTKILGKIVS